MNDIEEEIRENIPRILSGATNMAWTVNRRGREEISFETAKPVSDPASAAKALSNTLNIAEHERGRLVKIKDDKVVVFLSAFSAGNLEYLQKANLAKEFAGNSSKLSRF
jgi:hypothetical protein